MGGTFDLARVDEGIRGTCFYGKLHHFPSIDSTNARALAEAQAGLASDQVYIADEQTAGRGRGGHTWHSEPDRGLYLTALVRPQMHAGNALKISLAAGVAAVLAIFTVTGIRIDLRWPNDLVLPQGGGRSKKLGGILTESACTPDGTLRYAAIGIGINLNQLDFPEDLASTATSLRAACGIAVSREEIAAALLQHLNDGLGRLGSTVGQEDTARRFTELSTWVSGKRVQVAEGGGYTGVTAGLTATGLLKVQCDDGTQRVVRNGGVREL